MEEEKKDKAAEVVKVVTSGATRGLWEGFTRGLKKTIDEAAFFTGGAVGGYFANYFRSRGQVQKAEVVEKAQKLYAEGKQDEAKEIILQAGLFGFGYEDEALMLQVQAYVVQFFLDSEEEHLIGPFLDALNSLNHFNKKRLALVLCKIGGVEQRGQLLITLARTPGDMTQRLHEHLQIARVELDPENHPANVLVQEVQNAFRSAFGDWNEKREVEKQEIRERRAERERQRNERRAARRAARTA